MASIRCRNGSFHYHSSVEETRRCWQGHPPVPVPPFAASSPVLAAPVAVAPPVPQVRMATTNQVAWLRDHRALPSGLLTFDHADKLIKEQIDREKALQQTNGRSFVSNDPRLPMISSMIHGIPEGYYATAPNGENGHVDFLRIKTQKRSNSRYAHALTVQTQHSDVWSDPRMVFWPSNKVSVYSATVIDYVMEVLADYKTCALRYSVMLQRCMRCGKQLTDDRSRHYLVGPECEAKHSYTWPITFADEWNGKSFEQLRHIGAEYNKHHKDLGKV